MSDIKPSFWVDALRWRAEAAGASVYVENKGDPDAGVVLLKLILGDGRAQLFVPVRDFMGERIWSQPLGADPILEHDVDHYIKKRLDRDRDLWVVAIEDRHGRDFLNEPIEKS